MRLLENFTQLNYSAIVKILKKFAKNTGKVIDAKELLQDQEFVRARRLQTLIDKVTLTVAGEFFDGDYTAANALLLEKQVDFCFFLKKRNKI